MNFPGTELVGLCWVKVKLQLLAPRAVIRSRVLSAGGCFNNEGVSPAIYLIRHPQDYSLQNTITIIPF